jgi:hypothetical protein
MCVQGVFDFAKKLAELVLGKVYSPPYIKAETLSELLVMKAKQLTAQKRTPTVK